MIDSKLICTILIFSLICACSSSTENQPEAPLYAFSALEEIPFNQVTVNDSFWLPKIRIIQDATLPSLFQLAKEQGKINNFRIVAGKKKGKIRLYNAPDSDVYKLIEAASYSLSQIKNPALELQMDSLVDLILDAQDSTGYLHTQYMLPPDHQCSPDTIFPSNKQKIKTFGYGPVNRWKSMVNNWPYAYSQLYCAGHFMEAAVAHFRATGKTNFLNGAIKFADLICHHFNIENKKYQTDAKNGISMGWKIGNQNRKSGSTGIQSKYTRTGMAWRSTCFRRSVLF